jgi:hypothetical protein
MPGNLTPQIEARLTAIRGGAKILSPNVRAIAAYAGHTDCSLATLGFAARIDFDRLLAGTQYQVSFGQSPFAFSRGKAFEQMIAKHGYAATLELLRNNMGFKTTDVRIVNLRNRYQKNGIGLRLRADDTRSLIRQIVRESPAAPNLIDGAVLQTLIGGIPAWFEADTLAARFQGPIHAGEVKSFPVVDGRADPDKLAAALDQVSIYILLTKQLVDDVSGDASLVSSNALLITPKNVGLTPTLTQADVGKRIARIQRLLAGVPDVRSTVERVPPGLNFSKVADCDTDVNSRVDALHEIADRVGTAYAPACLGTCGNCFFCRDRTFRAGSPCLTGPQAVRLLPGVGSFRRAAELTHGAPPSLDETPVAPHLARAGRLYDAATEHLNVFPNAKDIAA